MMELLAPAGSMESLEACIKAGADAVYLGLDVLNARQSASNFTPELLCQAAYKLHERDMKLYVTVNTLVKDKQAEMLDYAARALCDAGVDAAIIQDLGVAAYFKKALPTLALHASTQMAVCNYQGAKWLKGAGFERCILAREATLDEIRDCVQEGIEVEVFGHGALCVSCSGQCLMSSVIGGRSGNRGLCAQPCRLSYRLNGHSGDLMSPKDLCSINFLDDIARAGVASLKLEGRLKSPDYVYNVVSAYRRALDGEKVDNSALRRVFNRGYTKGYFFGVDDGEIMSDPTVEHVESGENNFGVREKKIPIKASVFISVGKPISMSATDGINRAVATGDEAQAAISASLDENSVIKQIEKTGDTPYIMEKLDARVETGAFARVSGLNKLRRDCLKELSDIRVEKNRGCGRVFNPAPEPYPAFGCASQDFDKPQRTLLSVEASTPRLIEIARESGADEIIFSPFDITRLPDYVEADAVAIPPTLSGASLDEYNAWANKMDFKTTLMSNPAHLALKWPGVARIDWPMNVFNSYAVKALALPYAPSLELTSGEISALEGEKEIVVYGRIPLMHLKLCPLHAVSGSGAHDKCDACGQSLFARSPLTDRKGASFPLMRLKTREGCIISVLNCVPLMLLRRLDRLCNADRWRVILTDEDDKTASVVVRSHAAAIRGETLPDRDFIDKMKTTTGHYFRGVD